MIHTYGQLGATLMHEYPSIDPDTLDTLINEWYKKCLRAGGYVWSRLIINDAPIQIIGQYNTGTVTLTQGSTAVTGDTTNAWTSSQDQYSFRAVGRDEFYTFNFINSNDATLDRPYEGNSGSGLAYWLWKRIYTLPMDCQEIIGMRVPQVSRPMAKWSKSDLDFVDASRLIIGYPQVWVPYQDTSDGLPQTEIYPIPTVGQGLLFDYKTALNELTQPDDVIPAWFPWDALLQGCRVSLTIKATAVTNRTTGIWAARQQQVNKADFQETLDAAISEDINNRPPEQIAMDSRFTAHRRDRSIWGPGRGAYGLLVGNPPIDQP